MSPEQAADVIAMGQLGLVVVSMTCGICLYAAHRSKWFLMLGVCGWWLSGSPAAAYPAAHELEGRIFTVTDNGSWYPALAGTYWFSPGSAYQQGAPVFLKGGTGVSKLVHVGAAYPNGWWQLQEGSQGRGTTEHQANRANVHGNYQWYGQGSASAVWYVVGWSNNPCEYSPIYWMDGSGTVGQREWCDVGGEPTVTYTPPIPEDYSVMFSSILGQWQAHPPPEVQGWVLDGSGEWEQRPAPTEANPWPDGHYDWRPNGSPDGGGYWYFTPNGPGEDYADWIPDQGPRPPEPLPPPPDWEDPEPPPPPPTPPPPGPNQDLHSTETLLGQLIQQVHDAAAAGQSSAHADMQTLGGVVQDAGAGVQGEVANLRGDVQTVGRKVDQVRESVDARGGAIVQAIGDANSALLGSGGGTGWEGWPAPLVPLDMPGADALRQSNEWIRATMDADFLALQAKADQKESDFLAWMRHWYTFQVPTLGKESVWSWSVHLPGEGVPVIAVSVDLADHAWVTALRVTFVWLVMLWGCWVVIDITQWGIAGGTS